MLIVLKDTANMLVLTLRENSTQANPIYLFEFVNQVTHKSYYFIASDTSVQKQRYNQFVLTEKNNANTLNGEVLLEDLGYYDYTVYETDLNSLSGLTTAADAVPHIVKAVEHGKVLVVNGTTNSIVYSPNSNTSIVYNP